MSSDKRFTIKSDTLDQDFAFEGQKLACYMLDRKVKEIDVSSIASVEMKSAMMSGGSEMSLKILYNDGAKQKKFPSMAGFTGKVSDPSFQAFLQELKDRAPHARWTDGRKAAGERNADGTLTLPLAVTHPPFGYMGVTMGRTLVLTLELVLWGLLVLPLPFFAYLLAKGYKLKVAADGFQVTKVGTRSYRYDQVQRIQLQPIDVTVRQEGGSRSSFGAAQIIVHAKDGSSFKFLLGYREASAFFKAIEGKGLVDDQTQEFLKAA